MELTISVFSFGVDKVKQKIIPINARIYPIKPRYPDTSIAVPAIAAVRAAITAATVPIIPHQLTSVEINI